MESSHEIISRIAGRKGPRTVADAQGQPVPHPTMEKDAQTDVHPEAANRSIASAASAAVGEAANAVKSALFPQPVSIATTAHGIPMGDISHSYNVNGIISTSDANIIEQQQLFNRSKIVERQVHACGSGAFGAFRVTGDVSRLTKAKFLQPGSAETPIFARFSTVTYGREFPDSARNPRGMALKFYTEEGNYDVLMINFPVFFCRDPALGPSVIRSQARNPQNFQVNLDATVDFMSLVPESSLANVWFWSDHGTPVGWRFLDAYPCHTFKWVNAEGAATWVRYVFKSQQGIKNFDFDSAVKMCGEDPDFAKKDLWQTIADGGRPKWTFFIQTMTDEQATAAPFDAFDATKEWPTDQYPLMQVGELTLDRNPENYHRDVEQAAFSPGRMVPGIEPSPDLLLQFRCWFYGDAQLYRLGPNYHQIPVNCPFMAKQYHPTSRDGPTRVDTNGGVEAAYFPNSFSHPPMPHPAPHAIWQPVKVSGELARKAADRSDEGTDREYQQATRFYQKSLSDEERKHLHYNIAKAFKLVTRSDVKLRFLHQAYKVHPDYAAGIIQQAHALGALENSVTLKKVQELVSKLPHTVDQSRGYVPLPLPSV